MDFSIMQPTAEATVDASRFGMSPSLADNSPALREAARYMAGHPGTVLSIPKGVYYFAPSELIRLEGISNGIMEGNGSEFLFSKPNYFVISGCDTLKLQNFTIDWDWERGTRLASLVKVESIVENTVTFEFLEVDDASYAVNSDWLVLDQFDSETLTPGCAGGIEYYDNTIASNQEHLGGNRVRAKLKYTPGMKAGQVFLLYHRTYHGCAFRIEGRSQNITLKDVTLYSVCGFGVIGGGFSHHILISGLKIGLRPGTEQKYRISATVDGIHLKDTCGYFILENSDISFQGDDALNIHDNIGMVDRVDGSSMQVYATILDTFEVGAVLCFKSAEDFSTYPITAKVLSQTLNGNIFSLTLDRDVSEIPAGSIVYDSRHDSTNYIIRNNYFHENRARALVLNTGNGLVENNRFYKTQGAAIQITVDIQRGSWLEGTGMKHLAVRNNTFDTCNVNNWAPLIHFKALYGDRTFRDNNCFQDIEIVDNTMLDFPSRAIDAVCAEHVVISGNTIRNDRELPNSTPERGMISVAGLDYTVADNTWLRSPYMSDKVNEIRLRDGDSDPAQLVQTNNVLK